MRVNALLKVAAFATALAFSLPASMLAAQLLLPRGQNPERKVASASLSLDAIQALRDVISQWQPKLAELKDAENRLKAFVYFGEKDPPDASRIDEVFDSILKDNASLVQSPFRTKLSDEDLSTLETLIRRRNQILSELWSEVLNSTRANRGTLMKFGSIDRYQGLLQLADADQKLSAATGASLLDPEWLGLAANYGLDTVLPNHWRTRGEGEVALKPYGIVALIPSSDNPLEPLRSAENPFAIHETFVKSPSSEALAKYREWRDSPAVPNPATLTPTPDAVRITIIDTGVDWRESPLLRGYITGGLDLYGRDETLFLPAMAEGNLDHGTSVALAFLDVLSRHARRDILQIRFDVQFWKTSGLENAASFSMFASEAKQYLAWRRAFTEIQIRLKQHRPLPQIFSISQVAHTQNTLELLGNPMLLRQVPSLWVTAAGNESRELKALESDSNDSPECLLDVPEPARPAERILCIGQVVKQGSEYRIWTRSNYGNLVDLFVPNGPKDPPQGGTSFSTPRVAAIAAIVARAYPRLTAEELKLALLVGAESKEIQTAPSQDEPWAPTRGPKRKVRILDPETMLPRVLESAAKIAAKRPPESKK